MATYLYEFLKKKCEEKGFFYSQLQDKADLSHSVVQAIKRGRTQLKPATKQKLAAALGCTIGDIQDAIRRSDEVLENGEVLKKHVPKEPDPIPVPEPHCPYDDPVEPAAGLQRVGPAVYIPARDKPWDPPTRPAPMPAIVLRENPEATKEIISQVVQNTTIDALKLSGVMKIPKEDKVNHPAHYTQGSIECIAAIEASMTEEEFRGYLKGCQIKYLWRYRLKGGVEDLKKSRWYLDRLIRRLEESDGKDAGRGKS